MFILKRDLKLGFLKTLAKGRNKKKNLMRSEFEVSKYEAKENSLGHQGR